MNRNWLRTTSILVGILLCALNMSRARADLLAPGSKWIRHEIVIDNLGDYPNDQLFIYIVNQNQAMPVEAGRPIPRGNGNPINSVLMVSVPKDVLQSLDGKLDPGWFVGRGRRGSSGGDGKSEPKTPPAGVAISKKELSWIRAIGAMDRAQRIVTHFKIVKAPDDLTWTTVKQERFDGVGNPVSPGSLALPVFPSDDSSLGAGRTALIWAAVPVLAMLIIAARLTRRRAVSPDSVVAKIPTSETPVSG